MAELKLAKTFDTVSGGCACVYSTHVGGSQQNSTQVLYVQAGPCPCPDSYPGNPPGGSPNADSDGINFVNKLLEPVRGDQPPSEIDVECGCYTGDGNYTKWIVPKPSNISSKKLCLETSSSLPCVKPDDKYVGAPYTITDRKIYHIYKRDGYNLQDSEVLCYVGDTPIYKRAETAQIKSLQQNCFGVTKVTVIERSARNQDDFRYTYISDSIKKGPKVVFEEMLMNIIKEATVEEGETNLGREQIEVTKGEKNPNTRKLQAVEERTGRAVEVLTSELFINHSPDIKKRVLVGYMPCQIDVSGQRTSHLAAEIESIAADAEAILDLVDESKLTDNLLSLLVSAIPEDRREALVSEAERVEQQEAEELSKLQEVLLSAAVSEIVSVADVDRDEEDRVVDEETEAQKIEGDTIREERTKIPQIKKEETEKGKLEKTKSAKTTKDLEG